jgi:putative ABC transport system permease protein
MELLTKLWFRLKALARRGQLERDLEDEMSFHLAMREAKLGAPLPARRAFGNTTSIKEQCRDLWTFAWLESLAQDVRYALRQLRRDPGFAAVSAVTLALGIGATTSIFTMMDAILWRLAALPHTSEVVSVLQADPGNPHLAYALSAGDMEDIRASATTLASLTGWQNVRSIIVDAGGEPVFVETSRVSTNFFEVVGVQPAVGRGFQAGEDEPGRDLVAVISDDLWRHHFAADAGIVGRAVRINNRNYTVIGVMPPKFKFPRGWRDLWIPQALTGEQRRSRTPSLMETAGRLKPGRTLGNLASEVNTIAARLAKQYPNTNLSRRFVAWPIQRAMLGDYVVAYEAMLLGAALFVLLICCVNVANLQFARATSRWREMAVRSAMGAGRGRIVRQLLTESVVLAMAGALLGLLVARWSLAALKAGIPLEMRHYMSGWAEIGINQRALLFALGATAASGILSGLGPAWRCTRTNLAESLKEGGRGTAGAGRHRLRSMLVAAEIALAVVLLAGAGLMVRGFHALVGGRASLQPASLLTLRLSLSEDKYRTDRQIAGFYDSVLARIEVLPGVRSALAVTALPYSRHGNGAMLTIEGQAPQPGPPPNVLVQAVSLNYFQSMYIARQAGEALSNDAPPRAVISERMARRWWPDASPLGQRIRLGGPQRPWIRIAGVVADIPHSAIDRAPRQIVYVPYQQFPEREMNIGIRVAGDPMKLAPAATAAIRALDRELPIENIATLEDLVHQEAFGIAGLAWLMGSLGVLALVLATFGVYGVMSYLVSQQTHEIGIRLALGAGRGRVLRMIFRRGMATAVLGVIAGLIPAFGLGKLLAFAIWGVSSGDSVTMLGVPLGLAAVAAVAILIPALRAMKTDPMATLRGE